MTAGGLWRRTPCVYSRRRSTPLPFDACSATTGETIDGRRARRRRPPCARSAVERSRRPSSSGAATPAERSARAISRSPRTPRPRTAVSGISTASSSMSALSRAHGPARGRVAAPHHDAPATWSAPRRGPSRRRGATGRPRPNRAMARGPRRPARRAGLSRDRSADRGPDRPPRAAGRGAGNGRRGPAPGRAVRRLLGRGHQAAAAAPHRARRGPRAPEPRVARRLSCRQHDPTIAAGRVSPRERSGLPARGGELTRRRGGHRHSRPGELGRSRRAHGGPPFSSASRPRADCWRPQQCRARAAPPSAGPGASSRRGREARRGPGTSRRGHRFLHLSCPEVRATMPMQPVHQSLRIRAAGASPPPCASPPPAPPPLAKRSPPTTPSPAWLRLCRHGEDTHEMAPVVQNAHAFAAML